MSIAESGVTNAEVIPYVESQAFAGNESTRFAVGILALGNTTLNGLTNEMRAYSLLRGNVYAIQKNYMPVEELNSDGTETDAEDYRSVHFGVIENDVDGTRMVGAMRLIVKTNLFDAPLPIEEHYPEAFVDAPAALNSTEASRLIARHENPRHQNAIKWLLMTAGVSYVTQQQLGPVYGAVEPLLARGLNSEGMPVTKLCPAKFVPEFNATKQAIRIEVGAFTEQVKEDAPNLVESMEMTENTFVYVGTSEKPAELEDTLPA